MSPVERFAAWADRTDLTGRDLVRYRVFYAVVGLVTLQNFHWPASYPSSVYAPPPGPFEVFHGFLPLWVSVGLELVLAISFALLMFGRLVPAASVMVSVVYTVLAGFTYSLGKIDHTILLQVTPAVMAMAGWSGRGRVRGWALRLLAFVIGLSMFSAALWKAATGWLDLHTHAVQAYMIVSEYQLQNSAAFSRAFTNLPLGGAWEAIDWVTVVMEGSVVFAAFLDWRRWRLFLAVLAVFHLSVWLTLNIGFGSSMLIYGAFLPWSRLRLPAWATLPRGSLLVVVGVGVLAWGSTLALGNLVWFEDPAILVVGSAFGVWHVVQRLLSTIRSGDREPAAMP